MGSSDLVDFPLRDCQDSKFWEHVNKGAVGAKSTHTNVHPSSCPFCLLLEQGESSLTGA